MTRPIRVYEPIFSAEVEVRYTRNAGQLAAYVETELQPTGAPLYVMYLTDHRDFYTLIHECIHLVKRIFADRGIPFNAENDEAIAYCQTWWVQTLWRACHKRAKKGRKW